MIDPSMLFSVGVVELGVQLVEDAFNLGLRSVAEHRVLKGCDQEDFLAVLLLFLKSFNKNYLQLSVDS